ncbi:hypothetical protein V2W30_13225 [Streptomyces sp. Q6]|uniref:Uncharacterized protein n=1 Tax=Streptomyces citrinus TaxID=3118173 RepID=A0ACD5AAG9_9ACTN
MGHPAAVQSAIRKSVVGFLAALSVLFVRGGGRNDTVRTARRPAPRRRPGTAPGTAARIGPATS